MNSSSCQKFINLCHNAIIKIKPWDVYGFIVWPAGHKMDFHFHSHYQTIQLLDGGLDVDYGNGWEKIGHNNVHVLPPNCRHRFRTMNGSSHFGVEFTVESDDMGLLDAMRKAFPVPAVQPMCFHASWEESLRMGFPLEYSARLTVLNTLMDWTVGLVKAKDETADDPESVRLVELLKTWNHRSIKVTEVASKLYWSCRKAQRVCNRRFSCGIIKLHEKMRMEEASRLMLNSEISVGEVADMCGFDDIYGFSRTFTRVVGVPPSVFRRRQTNG